MKNVEAKRRKLEIPEHNRFIALFQVAAKSWITILLVWLVFLCSLVANWEIPASGAVLVCGALIAEILYQQQQWTSLSTDSTGTFELMPDEETGLPIVCGQYMWGIASTGKLSYLVSLSEGDEVTVDFASVRHRVLWYYHRTVARVSKVVNFAIVFTAVIGTLVWGYGHLLFDT